MKRHLVILDIICYLAIPFFMWNHLRESLGDYWAMLLSTVPGFVYTIYRFIAEKQFNISGLFIISSLLIGTSVNLLSGSAEKMLWNQVYLGFVYAAFYLLTIIIRRPLAMCFAADFAYLQGHPRKNSLALFSRKELFGGFQIITLLFVIRFIFQNSLKAWLILTYGVDGYGQMLIYMNISGWIFSGLITLGFILIGIKTNKVVAALYQSSASS